MYYVITQELYGPFETADHAEEWIERCIRLEDLNISYSVIRLTVVIPEDDAFRLSDHEEVEKHVPH